MPDTPDLAFVATDDMVLELSRRFDAMALVARAQTHHDGANGGPKFDVYFHLHGDPFACSGLASYAATRCAQSAFRPRLLCQECGRDIQPGEAFGIAEGSPLCRDHMPDPKDDPDAA